MAQFILSDNRAVEDFMEYYTDNGYLAYEKVADCAIKILVLELGSLGIKHEIFDRGKEGSAGGKAKAPASTRRTVMRRQNKRPQKYDTVEDILAEMHDLAGIRVALYYPNDFEKVEAIIKTRFAEVMAPRDWPDQRGPFPYPTLDGRTSGRSDISGRKSRFPGYFARHYRVKLREGDVTEPAVEGKTLEIQLMSLLMHAWSRMHHELIYKPRPGITRADEDDERLIDISSGIIMAGEQVLRQIQINLDRKKELCRLPFKNEHDTWSHLEKNWARCHDNALSEPQRRWLLGEDSAPESWSQRALYQSLQVLGYNTPERVDLLVKHCLDSYYGTASEVVQAEGCVSLSETRSIHATFVDMLFVSVVDQEDFKAQESEQLRIPRANTMNPNRLEAARLARYKALLVCNALRWFGMDSLSVVCEGRGNFPGPYPSGQEFLEILHSTATAEQKLGGILTICNFCDYLLDWDDSAWRRCVAMSRLAYFSVPRRHREGPPEGVPSDEFAITTCSWGFIRVLNYAAKNEDTTLNQSLQLLDGLEGSKANYADDTPDTRFLPYRYRNYRGSSGAFYTARPKSDGSVTWLVQNIDEIQVPGVPQYLGFTAVRQYLDHI